MFELGIGLLIFLGLFAICEIAVRIWVKPPKEHYYRYDAKNKLFRRKPRLDGTFKKRNVQGYFLLNNEGWNSTRDYFKHKDPGVYRIACIGSSETGAYEVDVKQAYPKIIEDYLNDHNIKTEVYTFAEDRAIGLAHALHLTRYAINNFNPDLILFNGSFVGEFLYGTTTKSHYMLLNIDANDKVKEVPPRNMQLPVLGRAYTPKSLLLQSRFIKYLRPKLMLRTRYNRLKLILFNALSGKKVVQKAKFVVRTNDKSYSEKYDIAIRYLLSEFKKIEANTNVKILYIIKPLRDESFNWNEVATEQARKNKLDEIAYRINLLKEFQLKYFELGDAFTKDFKKNGKKFDFLLNPHLNEHGHRVEGEAIASFLLESDLITKA
jgi:hypothetical protein